MTIFLRFMQVSEDDPEGLIPLVKESNFKNILVDIFEFILTPLRFLLGLIGKLFK